MYGLRQVERDCYEGLFGILSGMGFEKIASDESLSTSTERTEICVSIVACVDDMLLTCDNQEKLQRIGKEFKTHVEMFIEHSVPICLKMYLECRKKIGS